MIDCHLLSANRLADGAVVWLNDAHDWVEMLDSGCAFDDKRIESAKLAADQAVAANLVVAPAPHLAQLVDGVPVPVEYREQLRARGPSVRTDLGKQATLGTRQSGAALPRPVVPGEVSHAGVYRYDSIEREFLKERAQQFGQQVARRLSGELSEEEFKVYRLMNGLYLQLHGYMLRVAIPYGTLSAIQMRQLAYVAQTYDKGYGHFTTRQNLQLNWTQLSDAPEILSVLADRKSVV